MYARTESPSIAITDSRASMLARLGLGFPLAIFVTIGLLWVMQYPIANADATVPYINGTGCPTVRASIRPTFNYTPDMPPVIFCPAPPLPSGPPPYQGLGPDTDNPGISTRIPVPEIFVEPEIRLEPGPGDGDALPIVRSVPDYPTQPLRHRIEGFCTVEYSVTRMGEVRDAVVVEDQCTSSLFHRVSIEAALKFKYKPRVVNGEILATPGIRTRFTFKIDK